MCCGGIDGGTTAHYHSEHPTPQNMVHDRIESREEQKMPLPSEEQPLLAPDPTAAWRPPPAFLWIQLGLYNVSYPPATMLMMVNNSDHVQRLSLRF